MTKPIGHRRISSSLLAAVLIFCIVLNAHLAHQPRSNDSYQIFFVPHDVYAVIMYPSFTTLGNNLTTTLKNP